MNKDIFSKKLEELTEEELRLRIETLSVGCNELESNYRGKTIEERCDENLILRTLKNLTKTTISCVFSV